MFVTVAPGSLNPPGLFSKPPVLLLGLIPYTVLSPSMQMHGGLKLPKIEMRRKVTEKGDEIRS